MSYKNSNDVLEAMKTATEYDRDTKLVHVYAVLLKYEKKEIEKQKAIQEIKSKPYSKK